MLSRIRRCYFLFPDVAWNSHGTCSVKDIDKQVSVNLAHYCFAAQYSKFLKKQIIRVMGNILAVDM